MPFLDAFGPSHRSLLEGASVRLDLARGEYLLRRGEPGGDVFLLMSGNLDVVDSRNTPEVILTTLREGAVVGEMAFIDDSPRSADVRGSTDCVVLRWGRDDLRSLLTKHPKISAIFYERVARMTASRVRSLTDGAMAGSFTKGTDGPADADEVREWVDRIVDRVKQSLPALETALRQDPDEPIVTQRVRDVLDELEGQVDELFTAHRTSAAGALATELLRRELHPYLVRSSLADRSLRRPPGVVGTAEVLAHVLVGTAGGDGHLGRLIDQWLLDRPSFVALRSMQAPIAEVVRKLLPDHRNRRVLLVNAGTGSLVARLDDMLDHPPTTLTVLDQSRAALSLLDVERSSRSVELATLQENLVRFASGRARLPLPPQDAVVLHGLLEYLPERLAVSMLAACGHVMAEDGVILVATLGPSRDQVFLDRLIAWPTIRRTPAAVDSLLTAAGYQTVSRIHLDAPAQLVVALVVTQVPLASPPSLVPPPPEIA